MLCTMCFLALVNDVGDVTVTGRLRRSNRLNTIVSTTHTEVLSNSEDNLVR